eukprot:CAMPEP_0113488408 /NCGR_PEP_ID=MMETSP0014_2-20120614/26002_1 /TAXON_ID=2857 /ORGANISM="Nitzschia sp." /LENGTH=445 /DNA_ID=CAMNT_0000382121 /DNA_START=108 /DNA_END=1445 /DNA_ORIENTATION=+ /assembly_acc=CAM_ASM_000159
MLLIARRYLLLWTSTTAVTVTATAAFGSSLSSSSSLSAAFVDAYHHNTITTRNRVLYTTTATVAGGLPLLTKRSGRNQKASIFAGSTLFGSHHSRSISSSSASSVLRMSSSSEAKEDGGRTNVLRVALCQFPVTHEKDVNHDTANKYLSLASQKGADLVVLPEIWNSPYATAAFPEYAESLPEIGDTEGLGPSSQLLIDAATKYKMWVVGGSIPERTTESTASNGGGDNSNNNNNNDDDNDADTDKIFNTCLVINPEGVIIAKHRKVHLFDIDVPGGITFFESDTLSPGSTISHFTTPWGEIGLGICYDIRFAEYAQILRQTYNVCVLIYPGAFNMTTGPAHWEILQRARAVDNQCFVLTASPSRVTKDNEGEEQSSETKSVTYPRYTAWGHSTAVSPWGEIVATTDEKEGIVMADLDLQRVNEIRSGIPIGNQRRTDLYKLSQD